LGLVGLGSVIGSQKTARLPFSFGGLKGSCSFSLFVASIEDCDMPVEGALAITDVALGVAFWKIGLLINGRTVAVGADVLEVFWKGAIGADISSGFAGIGGGVVVAGTGGAVVGEVVVEVGGVVGFVAVGDNVVVGEIGVGDFSLFSNFLSITDTIGEMEEIGVGDFSLFGFLSIIDTIGVRPLDLFA